MCDKSSFRPAPKTEVGYDALMENGYDALMEKRKENPDITMWFTDQDCDICGSPVFTSGKLYWCKKGCSNDGRISMQDKDYMGFISDLIK